MKWDTLIACLTIKSVFRLKFPAAKHAGKCVCSVCDITCDLNGMTSSQLKVKFMTSSHDITVESRIDDITWLRS